MHNPPLPFSSLSHLHPLVSFVGKSIPSIPSPICPCISNLTRFHGSFNFVTCRLRQVYDSFLAIEAENPHRNPYAANDNLEIFLGHSTLGRSNFHAAPIPDLQFRPPANRLLISRDSDFTGGRNIALLNLPFFVNVSLSSFLLRASDPFKAPRITFFFRHSRLIYIPVSF